MTHFEVSSEAVLSCPMEGNDADAPTIRTYLVALLRGLWKEREGFSGKRPFGNSGWEFDVYEALVRAELIGGSFDSDGYLEDADTRRGDELVLAAIEHLSRAA